MTNVSLRWNLFSMYQTTIVQYVRQLAVSLPIRPRHGNSPGYEPTDTFRWLDGTIDQSWSTGNEKLKWKMNLVFMVLGFDQRQRNCVCWCSGLLSCVKRHRIGCQRGKCSPFDASTGPDDLTQYPRHQRPPRDSWRPRNHFGIYAGSLRFKIY